MRRPITALLWEIARRRRGSAITLLGLMLLGLVFKLALSDQVLGTEKGQDFFQMIESPLMVASVVFVLAIFNFTESSPEKNWSGFPYRLFVLPVPTLLLIALPVISGIAAMGLVCGFWLNFVLALPPLRQAWTTLLIIAFMVLFQAVLWCLASFRTARLLVLGLAGPAYIFIAFLPSQQIWTSPWFSQKCLSFVLCGQILLLFGCSWLCVARQRCGGGRRTNWLRAAADWMLNLLPRRKTDFSSPASAQFWFEWRRAGMVLPLCVAGLLVFYLVPLSLHYKSSGVGTLQVLFWTLAAPVLLAAVVGKGFSKPDFWSNSLAYLPFNAVRPIASGDIIVVKMKVAALSAAISWALTLLFLILWLPGWADLESLNTIRVGFYMAYDHTVVWQYFIAALIIAASALSTWKCLVAGLGAGLSGSWKRYLALPLGGGLLIALGLVALAVMLNHDTAVRAWYRADPDRPLSWMEDLLALGIIAKFFLAARAWRDISPRRVRNYLLFWLGATCCLVALVMLLWAHGLFNLMLISLFDFLPWDTRRLFGLLLLLALAAVPLARIGLAPSFLARNRHRP